ncbi:MAG TPA: PIG-L family deacetylase [Candidatus Dormibacteraeota bacterium]|nr:PIG-L family deacetylase [Candidatus Dormibacteraeota bacterium]
MSTILLVHAHPDDEAIMTGGVMQKAHSEGHRVVLVTSTRGEVGEIHNMDEAENRPRLGQVRTAELAAATRILGVDRQEFLGYRDSGMAGTDDNQNPASFHQAPLDQAAERLAKIIREERPDVVVSYDPTGTYFHPDHIKAHQVTTAALDLLKAEGWEPRKFYWHAFPRSGLKAWAELSARPDAPEPPSFPPNMGVPDEQITTVVDVRPYVGGKLAAFRAHLSQNGPEAFFLSTPKELRERAFGEEHFVLARGEVGGEPPEPDLFAGVAG